MVDPVTPAAKPGRLWRVLLIISLALNLAILGLVAGAGFSGRWKEGPPRGFDLSLGPIAQALSREQREEIRGRLRGQDGLRPITPRDARADRQALLEVLRADDFDAAVLEALLTKQQDRVRGLQAAAQKALAGQIAAMSPQDRADFADRLEQEMGRHRERP